jgi:hypothetical protein
MEHGVCVLESCVVLMKVSMLGFIALSLSLSLSLLVDDLTTHNSNLESLAATCGCQHPSKISRRVPVAYTFKSASFRGPNSKAVAGSLRSGQEDNVLISPGGYVASFERFVYILRNGSSGAEQS